MKFGVVDRIERGDAISSLRTGPGLPERYSEWHHFTVDDAASGLHGICNLALSGDVRHPARARAGVSLVVAEQGRWHGTVNVHPVEDARFAPGRVDLAVGGSSVRLRDGGYDVRAALKDGSVVLDARWSPTCEAVRVDGIGGLVSTFVVPRLAVDGTLSLGGREHRLEGAVGYHDHNWGYWRWGADLGWRWGYVLEPPGGPGGPGRRPLSLVFGQVTDATGALARSDLVLLVWTGERCTQVFLGDAVTVATDGELPGGAVPRVPGAVALVEPLRRPAPGRLEVRAEEGGDRLEVVLDVASAVQLLVPDAGGGGVTTVTELAGRYAVRGVLDGEKIEFATEGLAELAG